MLRLKSSMVKPAGRCGLRFVTTERTEATRDRASVVTNLRPHLPAGFTIEDFKRSILSELERRHAGALYPLDFRPEVEDYIREQRETHFEHPDWIHAPIGRAK